MGVVAMVALIYWQGTKTSGASSVGIPVVGAASIPSNSTGGGSSTGATTGPRPTNPGTGGSASSGKGLFTSSGCGSCHTFAPAGASGTIGPNLADAYKSAKADGNAPLDGYLYQSIADPNAYIVSGYSASLMPSTFGSSLSNSQINDLVAFLAAGQAGK
ncbi:MAG TPA: c-type cytochrome [Gaiellales bacterium]|nr:c-type cytochrome [Gaiellales bacterium]